MGKPFQQIHDPAPMSDVVPIQRRDFGVNFVDMLQQNWALTEPEGSKVTIYLLHDVGGVFDELTLSELREAQAALRLNGFPATTRTQAKPKSSIVLSRHSAASSIPMALFTRLESSGRIRDRAGGGWPR